MHPRIVSCLAIALALVPGCDKIGGDAENEGETAPKGEDGEDDTKTDEADEAGGQDSADSAESADGAETAEAASAGDAGAELSADAIRECPKTLSGRESTDRVIGKACGTVEVEGNYQIDGATLLIEGGATLAFKDGAMLSVGYRDSAKLLVKATADEPVTFTSAGDKAAGVWKGVALHPKAARSSIEGLVVEYAGDKAGAVRIQAPDVTFKSSKIQHVDSPAIEVSKEGRLVDFAGNTFDDVGKIAMRVSPLVADDIQEGNTFPDDARVHVNRARLHESVTWRAIGTPMLVVGEVRVEGAEGTRATLTVAPGAEVDFDGDGSLLIGYAAQGGLTVEGTADKPVVFTSNEREQAGAWPGIYLWGKGEGHLAHLTLRHGGKKDDRGVLYVKDGARLEAENVTFEDNTVGLVVHGAGTQIEAFDHNTFKDTPVAMKIPPRVLGELGGENTYEGDPRILVQRGRVEEEQTWTPQAGAQTEIEGEVRLDEGTITIEPGSTLHMKDGSGILVGYTDIAALRAEGKADAKISFVGLRDEPGTWKGITFHGKARGNVLKEIELRNAGTPAGLYFKNDADATIENYTCAKCEGPALKRDKNAKVESKGVKATEGTPSEE